MCKFILLIAFFVFFVFCERPIFFRPARVFEQLKPVANGKLPPYETLWFNQVVDHFNFLNPNTFRQKIIVSTTFYDPSTYKNSPIFFYTGNEGDILMFYNNTGRIFELAEELHGLVIFIEHRYYGESWPSKTDYSFMSSEQALADYIAILYSLQDQFEYTVSKTPIIAVGGSYGGMLSAWIRIKYPHVITGAFAASAPDLHFPGFVDPYEYSQIITESFETYGCNVGDVKKAFSVYQSFMNTGAFDVFNKNFKMCKPLQTTGDLEKLEGLIINTIGGLAVVNYPDSADFLQSLPPYPVKLACDRFQSVVSKSDNSTYLNGFFQILNVFYNSTQTISCIDINWGWDPRLGDKSWDYQACSEMIMPAGSNGKSDFFPAQLWDLSEVVKDCEKRYPGIRVSPGWCDQYFHGDLIKYSSNIIFSNGGLDPWRSGGVFKQNIETDKITCLTIKDMPHHVDLRFASDKDPIQVTQAREQELEIIKSWIQ